MFFGVSRLKRNTIDHYTYSRKYKRKNNLKLHSDEITFAFDLELNFLVIQLGTLHLKSAVITAFECIQIK